MQLATRLIIEEALEAENRQVIGRDYCARVGPPGQGYRNGNHTGLRKTAKGDADRTPRKSIQGLTGSDAIQNKSRKSHSVIARLCPVLILAEEILQPTIKDTTMDKWYLERLSRILPPYPREMHQSTVFQIIRNELRSEGRKIPDELENTIRGTYNCYCEQYAAFERARQRSGRRPLFKSMRKRSGYWSLHPDAQANKPFEPEDFL